MRSRTRTSPGCCGSTAVCRTICNDGIDPIKTMCRDALAQEAVAKQLKTIVCLGNATERSASYKDGTLTIHTGLGVDKGDIRGSTRKALGDGLK